MPFLFERIDDETELLLPENLLHSDSIVRKLVSEIDEADWQEVEIIGWLYQFYISEKKDEVIGKVVKSEDIPAATQLFTPNWIVKYLVQNSLGRQWLATYPDSSLKSKWEYYIEPAEQTPEVQAKLNEITPTTLNPEELTIMDPACGSGHILVEAYDLLKDIYLERGYRLRDIPRLILTKNVYGLEIDDRAAQLACFALLMKARADDRKIFDPPPQLNVLAIQETNGLDIPTIVQAFTDKRITKDDDLPVGEFGFMVAARAPLFAGEAKVTPTKADEQVAADLKVLLSLFENAKTYGSLLTIPPRLTERLPKITEAVEAAKAGPNLAVQNSARIAGGFVMAATLLAKQYDAVVANPPYMGEGAMTLEVRGFAKRNYPRAKTDLFAMFIERSLTMSRRHGRASLVTMHGWMFLSTFADLRCHLLATAHLQSLLHIGPRGFDSISGEVVQAAAFVLENCQPYRQVGSFVRLVDGRSESEKIASLRVALKNDPERSIHHVASNQFAAVPGSPIAYWESPKFRECFASGQSLADRALFRQGMSTTNAERFERHWSEIDVRKLNLTRTQPIVTEDPAAYWYPFNKGGSKRRWFGNLETVVRYERNGQDLLDLVTAKYPKISDPEFVIKNRKYFFLPAVTYSSVGTGSFVARAVPSGCAYSVAGPAIFADGWDSRCLLAMLCSSVATKFLAAINPTLGFQITDVGKIPASDAVLAAVETTAVQLADQAVAIAKSDWDDFERSWTFRRHPLVPEETAKTCLSACWTTWEVQKTTAVQRMCALETANNRLFASAYGLEAECLIEALIEDVTLSVADSEDDCASLLSFATGCAMGRYSLDKPGLIYANSGNEGFDPSQYKTFPADPDGIIPITEHDWFPDSAARRFEEFVSVAWPKEHLEENLQLVADSLTGKSVSDPRETIRSYFANDFYKHHLQTYKKRPIYWLFCSGKQRAFQALVYLHRYHEGTLARMRTEYVIPLQGKIASRINQLEGDISKATSSAHGKKLTKEKDALEKQRVELLAFDEKLRHYADQRIKLDLDDGVKVNYGKFGDLLAEVKAICGDKEEEE
jgi:hypothetical protein